MITSLVTGAAGFLGSHLCDRLLKSGHKVIGVDNLYTGKMRNLENALSNPAFSFVEADVCNLSPERFEKVDEVYSLACPASPVHYQAKKIFTALTSIKGILFCLELAKRDGAKLFHASTSEVYGDALVHPQSESYWGNVNTIGIRSCYDEGKRVAETLCADYMREFDVDIRLVRIFNTYGPRMCADDGRVVSNFIVQALRGEDITIYGNGSQTRSFQYADDLIEAFSRYMGLEKCVVRAFFSKNGRPAVPVINTGNPNEFTILELAQKVLAKLPGTSSRVVFKPLPGDDPKMRRPDITLAKELLGWEPVIQLDEGLDRTIAYFQSIC